MRLKSFRKNADKSIEVVCYPISENSNVYVFFLLEKKFILRNNIGASFGFKLFLVQVFYEIEFFCCFCFSSLLGFHLPLLCYVHCAY